ncbi:hypothetical protein [Pseudomonas phage pPA-3099-2aT.2]|uniref:Uncharacterized protein n=1 Tax=Pseudomonas phage pPA-3099-2aT.2 TaxID=3003808 RepID=A0AAF0AU49_9CAUD|nr:hypothetical protein QE325_gp119 [Pseudomonas phage pPA-3099-2aT.2]WBQ35262.1 hypothetical protein [Pseudomonas phage pPA-3099-2aT.2]
MGSTKGKQTKESDVKRVARFESEDFRSGDVRYVYVHEVEDEVWMVQVSGTSLSEPIFYHIGPFEDAHSAIDAAKTMLL